MLRIRSLPSICAGANSPANQGVNPDSRRPALRLPCASPLRAQRWAAAHGRGAELRHFPLATAQAHGREDQDQYQDDANPWCL